VINLTITTHVKQGKRNELLSACKFIAEQTLKEKGCLSHQIYQDLDEESLIKLTETWETRALLDEYFRSDIFKALTGALKLLGESYDIRINDGSNSEGIEAVHAAQSIKDKPDKIKDKPDKK
jgi:quinol monooxygenase YgiN